MNIYSPRKPDVILWDWDNTLVDSWSVIHECYNETFRRLGLHEWTREQVLGNVHRSLEDSFPELFGVDRWEEARDIYRGTFEHIHIERLTPLDGALQTLELCRDSGIISGVVSNKLGKNLRKESAHLEWDRFFRCVVGAADAEKDKPAPEHPRLALQQCDIKEGAHVWFIGDSNSDLQCAVNINAQAVLFGDGAHVSGDVLQSAAPVVKARDHAELQACLSTCIAS